MIRLTKWLNQSKLDYQHLRLPKSWKSLSAQHSIFERNIPKQALLIVAQALYNLPSSQNRWKGPLYALQEHTDICCHTTYFTQLSSEIIASDSDLRTRHKWGRENKVFVTSSGVACASPFFLSQQASFCSSCLIDCPPSTPFVWQNYNFYKKMSSPSEVRFLERCLFHIKKVTVPTSHPISHRQTTIIHLQILQVCRNTPDVSRRSCLYLQDTPPHLPPLTLHLPPMSPSSFWFTTQWSPHRPLASP